MILFDLAREICPCQVCKSDLAYIAPCDFENSIEFEVIYTEQEIAQTQKEIS